MSYEKINSCHTCACKHLYARHRKVFFSLNIDFAKLIENLTLPQIYQLHLYFGDILRV